MCLNVNSTSPGTWLDASRRMRFRASSTESAPSRPAVTCIVRSTSRQNVLPTTAAASNTARASPPHHPPAAQTDGRGDLAPQARLADPRRPEHGHEMRPSFGHRLRPHRAHQLELVRAPDERIGGDRPLGGGRRGLDGDPGLHRLALASRVDRRHGLTADRVATREVRVCADDQPADRGRRLQARGGVDHVSHRERLAGPPPRARRSPRRC